MKSFISILTFTVLISLILQPSLTAQAQYAPPEPPALLGEPGPDQARVLPVRSEGGRLLRSRDVRLALENLPAPGRTGDALSLPLFADARFTAWVLANQVGADGSLALSGQVEGRTDSSWMALVRDGQLTGFLQVGSQAFLLRPGADGQTVVEEVDTSAFPDEQEMDLPLPDGYDPSSNLNMPPPETTGTEITIDLLVVYTPAARQAAGGETAMQDWIALGVYAANESYANSGITQRVRLVGAREVAYTGDRAPDDGSKWTRMLTELTRDGDGVLDEVHQLREQYGADLVTLVTEVNYGSCGIAWVLQEYALSTFSESAFSVVDRGCMLPNYSLAHELGHLMGATHDAASAGGGQGFFPYSYGYQAPNRSFRTIMAYNCPGSCPRVNYWSNPDGRYNGQPTGVAGQADNRRTLNATAAYVAAFRPTRADWTPMELTATPLPHGIELTWSAGGPAGTLIERSVESSKDWQAVATLPAGVVSYLDTAVTPGKVYVYRVRAAAYGWVSPSSNEDAAAVLAMNKAALPERLFLPAIGN